MELNDVVKFIIIQYGRWLPPWITETYRSNYVHGILHDFARVFAFCLMQVKPLLIKPGLPRSFKEFGLEIIETEPR